MTVRFSRMRAAVRVASVVAGFVFVTRFATPLSAHEKGAIAVTPKQAAAGDTLVARATKMSKGASFRIELRSALKTISFGRMKADTAGVFEMRIPLPPDVGAGSYVLVAIASDGDISAQANVMITRASAKHDMANMPGMDHSSGGMPGMDMSATAKPMTVEVTTTSAEWIVILGVVVLAAGGGFFLIASAKKAPAAA